MKQEKNLQEVLKSYFGFDTFKGEQEAVVQNVLQGKDTFVLMPTGGGKSLCYQLPSLMMEGTAIVISPLIALMKNQVDMVRSFSEQEGIAHFMNSTLSRPALEKVKSDVLSGLTKMLYVAPETLTKEDNAPFFMQIKKSFYAIDEAHCISEWGHDFRPEYRNIRPTIDKIGRAPIIALTATATHKVSYDILKNLGILDASVYKSSFNRANLYYEIRPKNSKTASADLVKLIKTRFAGKSGIVYCLSRKEVENLAEILLANDIKAAPYHAGLETSLRSSTQDDFLMERIDVIVATIAFGMGIDKPDVRFVIHYDFPKSLEGYYQETGRAGRDGGEGACIAYYSVNDIQKLEKFIEDKPLSEQNVGKQLLKETVFYAESSVCRRRLLLHYFGEEYPEENCGNCDNCLKPKVQVEAKEELTVILETIQDLKENFDDYYIIDVLTGHKSDDIIKHQHDQYENFGIADKMETMGNVSVETHWLSVVRQACIAGLLVKDIESGGALKLSEEGLHFMKHPHSFKVTEDNEFEAEENDVEAGSVTSSALDPALFNMLKNLRKQIAKKNNLPPYVIFQDPSLEAMASMYPITIEELQNISGVGQGKANKYGLPFCTLIKQYCEENEIERPEDMRVRTTPNKSKRKLDIISKIDHKVDLEDIANANGIEFDELLSEIEAIVYSGTKLNIDYFIDEMLDDDVKEDAYEYFRESETDSIDVAMSELGDDYTEEELRLVRIQFISDNN